MPIMTQRFNCVKDPFQLTFPPITCSVSQSAQKISNLTICGWLDGIKKSAPVSLLAAHWALLSNASARQAALGFGKELGGLRIRCFTHTAPLALGHYEQSCAELCAFLNNLPRDLLIMEFGTRVLFAFLASQVKETRCIFFFPLRALQTTRFVSSCLVASIADLADGSITRGYPVPCYSILFYSIALHVLTGIRWWTCASLLSD